MISDSLAGDYVGSQILAAKLSLASKDQNQRNQLDVLISSGSDQNSFFFYF